MQPIQTCGRRDVDLQPYKISNGMTVERPPSNEPGCGEVFYLKVYLCDVCARRNPLITNRW